MNRDPGLYGPGSATWRMTRERVLLLGGPRALLLQLAHPLVAAGVAEHSGFRRDPFARLRRTLEATLAIVFGETSEAERAAAQINGVHGRVHGKLPVSVGRFPAGTQYDARDPELLLWVHATLVDTTLAVYPRLVGPADPALLERAYEESKAAARLLLVPDDLLPPTLDAFRAYVRDTIASDTIAIADFQRELARDVLYPRMRLVPRAAFEPTVAITAALLPEKIRDGYGLRLDGARRLFADWSLRAVRATLPLVPSPIRLMPHARRAYRRTSAT